MHGFRIEHICHEQDCGKTFDPLYCNLVAAGEVSGALPQILKRQCAYLTLISDLRRTRSRHLNFMNQTPIQPTEEHASRLYDAFVHFMNAQFGGPKTQRTPTTDSALRIANHMQDKDGEQLCYELCREYLSNYEEKRVVRTDLCNEREARKAAESKLAEAREKNAKLVSVAERAIDDLRWFYEGKADGIILEFDQLKEETK